MNATELCYTPATTLAAAIRAKEISPVEVTEAVLARIARLNPTLNASALLLLSWRVPRLVLQRPRDAWGGPGA